MRRFLICLISVLCFNAQFSSAGNSNGIGESGASELLINPWARSSGWNWINSACISGIEAMKLNVAGLAGTEGTEVDISHTLWLDGSGITLNTLGFSQNLGKSGGVLGIDIMSIGFGNINITTTGSPDGGLGTYSPQFINFGLGYAKLFSNNIYAGIAFRGISEAVSNVASLGFEADAGVQYHTGPESQPDRIKFGISLRNIGTKMNFSGDGLAYANTVNNTNPYTISFDMRADAFNMPSLLNIGASYDFKWGGQGVKDYRLTIAANFASHSYSQDQGGLGAELAYKEIFMIRAGYNYQGGITAADTRTTVLTGLSAGLTIEIPLKKKDGPKLGLDYAYQTTSPFSGVHSFGLRLTM